jgi:hypothetical protein
VHDPSERALGRFYFEKEPGRGSVATFCEAVGTATKVRLSKRKGLLSTFEVTRRTKETIIRLVSGIERAPMRKSLAEKNSTRAMLLIAAAWRILDWPSTAIAQHLADRQNGTVPASTAAPSIIVTDGELKATIFAYRDGNLIMQYKYYWWRDACYLTYEPTNSAPVPPAACY